MYAWQLFQQHINVSHTIRVISAMGEECCFVQIFLISHTPHLTVYMFSKFWSCDDETDFFKTFTTFRKVLNLSI